jgi:AcrR family transcriptional regulator
MSIDQKSAPTVEPRATVARPGREGGKRDLNRRERTRQLCDAAMALFLDRGIEAVSIDEITSRAGVAKGSFYRYFDGRDQLVDTLFAPLVDYLRRATAQCREALEAAQTQDELTAAYHLLVRELLPLFIEHRAPLELYLRENRRPPATMAPAVRALRDEVTAISVEITVAAHAHQLLRPMHPRVSSLAVIGASERLILEYLEGSDLGDPLEAAGALVSLALDGLHVSPAAR